MDMRHKDSMFRCISAARRLRLHLNYSLLGGGSGAAGGGGSNLSQMVMEAFTTEFPWWV